MSDRHVRCEVDEGVALITLDRPDQLNTFTGRMARELGEAYRRCDEDDSIRAAVLTGAGKVFCAGADMTAAEQTFAPRDAESFSASPIALQAWEVRKPIIAALNGHAIGIGLTLALQCDLRVIALEGKYGVLQVRRGMMPDCGAHFTLPRLIGLERAADILLTGRKFDGEEALRLGLAGQALPAEQVLPRALEIATEIAAETAPLSVAVTKKLLWQSSDLTADQVAQLETQLHHHLMSRPDAIEGPMAFLERRQAVWKSRVSRDWPDWPEPGPPKSRSS